MEDGAKRRDLEDRTFRFAESVRTFVKQLPRSLSNAEDVRQLVRASGSVAANWIEADEALSKKDFLMRVKICRKEAKESRLFLRLLDAGVAKNTAVRVATVWQRKLANSRLSSPRSFRNPVGYDFLLLCFLPFEILPGIWCLGFGISG